MPNTALLRLASGNGSPAVHDDFQPDWRTRLTARWDLASHLHHKRQFNVTMLIVVLAATAMITGLNPVVAVNYTALAVSLFGLGTLVVALAQFASSRQLRRLYGPATPAMIAALRQLIAPSLWQAVSDAAARQRRVAPDLPVTPALIYVWLDQAINAERGQTIARAIVAAQAQAFG